MWWSPWRWRRGLFWRITQPIHLQYLTHLVVIIRFFLIKPAIELWHRIFIIGVIGIIFVHRIIQSIQLWNILRLFGHFFGCDFGCNFFCRPLLGFYIPTFLGWLPTLTEL